MQQLRNLDPLMYLRALGLFARNPSIVVVPLLMGIVGVFVTQIGGGSSGGGILGGLTLLLILLLNMFAFGVACIIADMAWRRGRASFDDGWNEARRKGGEILTAAMGFTFVLYLAQFAGTLVGPVANVLLAVAIYFLIYTIPAAAIGGVPGSAALQISIERARSHPLPTIVVTVVSVAAFFLSSLLMPLFTPLLAQSSFASLGFVVALFGAVVQAIVVGYIALIVTKTYSEISFGRR
jgi:hypothetical protein